MGDQRLRSCLEERGNLDDQAEYPPARFSDAARIAHANHSAAGHRATCSVIDLLSAHADVTSRPMLLIASHALRCS